MNKHKNKNSLAKALSDETLENVDGGTIFKDCENGKDVYSAIGEIKFYPDGSGEITFVGEGKYYGEKGLEELKRAIDEYNEDIPDEFKVSKTIYDCTNKV